MAYDAGEAFIRFTGNYSGMVEQARREATRTGEAFNRSLQAELRRNVPTVDVRVNADTARARAEVAALDTSAGRSMANSRKQASLLRDAIVAIGPAAIPVGVVVGASLAGALPSAAALALGIGGIRDELKSGALEGTEYGVVLKSAGTEFKNLKAIAAGGLLGGIDKGLASAHPLFAEFNGDVAQMSAQLGDIIAGAGPGLLNLLIQLNPLFRTFGDELVKGANHLEKWSSSTTGIQSFVAYAQRELPEVEHTVGQLVELFVHAGEGLAPIGHIALTSLGTVAELLNSLPIGVLTRLESSAVAVYIAFRSWQLIRGLISGVGNAYAQASGAITAATTRIQASSVLQAATAAQAAAATEAAAAAEAAGVQRAAVAEAEARQQAAEAALISASAAARTGSVVAIAARAQARAVEEAAIEQVAAARLAAEAAEVAAVRTAAASQAAAEAVVVAGEEASVGWAAALGPVGALAVGVGVLATVFLGASSSEHSAAAATDDYTESVKKSTDALARVNKQATIDALSKRGALVALDDLHKRNLALAVSTNDLTTAINGPQKAYDALQHTLNNKINIGDTGTERDVQVLTGSLKTLRGELGDTIRAQLALDAAEKSAQALYDGGSAAARRQAASLGATSSAYLSAQVEARKNTEQTRQQTVAFQLANDAGSLLQQTLDKLSGKKISYAQADNAFEQQLVSLAQNLQKGSNSIQGLSSDAIKNRGDLLSLVTGAQQTADAYGTMTGSVDAGRRKLIELRRQIIDNAVAHGEDREQVTKYIDKLLKIPTHIPPTVLDVIDRASDPLKRIKLALDALQNKSITITQYEQLLKIHPHADNRNEANRATSGLGGNAAGTGAGGLPDGYFTMNESGWELGRKVGSRVDIWSHEKSMAMTGLPDRLPGYAGGTPNPPDVVTLSPSGASKSAASTAESKAEAKAANDAKQKLQEASQALIAFEQAVGITRSAVSQAEHDLLKAAKAAGASSKELAGLQRIGDKLASTYGRLNSVEARLGTAPTRPTAYDNLATAKGDYKDLRDSIISAIMGSFAIASAGQRDSSYSDAVKQGVLGSFSLPGVAATPVTTSRTLLPGVSAVTSSTASKVAGSEIVAALTKAEADAHAFVSVLKRLRSEGLPQGLLDQLASAGPSALPQAQALLAMTPKALASVGSTYRSLVKDSAALSKPAVTFGTIYGEAKTDAANAKKFADGIKKLASEGLRPDLVRQLAEAGPAALPQVEALLSATPKQIHALNGQAASLSTTAGSLGSSVAQDLYGAGVKAAQGIVDGLKSQERELEKQMKHLADTMVSRFRKDLDIHSPSRVFHQLGTFTGAGLVGGIRQQIPNVSAAVGDLMAAQMTTTAIAGRATMPSGGLVGPSISQTINPQAGQSEYEIAEMSANRLMFALRSR